MKCKRCNADAEFIEEIDDKKIYECGGNCKQTHKDFAGERFRFAVSWKDDMRWHCGTKENTCDVKGKELDIDTDEQGNKYITCPACLRRVYKGQDH